MPTLLNVTDILDGYKKKKIDWSEYEKRFKDLLKARNVHILVSSLELHKACLLCSEPTPEKCHRRLVAEYLKSYLKNIKISHL